MFVFPRGPPFFPSLWFEADEVQKIYESFTPEEISLRIAQDVEGPRLLPFALRSCGAGASVVAPKFRLSTASRHL